MSWAEATMWMVVAVCAMVVAVHIVGDGFQITIRREDDE